MSDYEHYRGTIEEVELVDDDLRKTIIELLGYAGKEVTDDDDEYMLNDYIYEYLDDKYIVIDESKLYKIVQEEKTDPYEDIFRASVNSDGTISFDVKYYNGGCCKREAIQTALIRMEK